MSYLDRLKKSANVGEGSLQNHQNPASGGFVGFEGTPPGPFQKITGTEAANDPLPKAPSTGHGMAFPAWLLHFANRNPLEVWFSPAVGHAEALAAYPDALAAEPLPYDAAPRQYVQEGARQSVQESAQKSAVPTCKTCRHLKRPGLSEGYCGERDDLPPAYWHGHPLRRLPDDQGKSCTAWELST